MPATTLLSTADLDEIGHRSFTVDDPLALATELVDAVDSDRVADDSDIGYALLLAAEITERAEQFETALDLVDRAIEAYDAHGKPEHGFPRAVRAGLLLHLGRDAEGMAELTALRPRLETDPDVASYLTETLEEAGRAELAEEWLTEAVNSLVNRRAAPESAERNESDVRTAAMIYGLTQVRHRLRGDLALPHDELDHLADRLSAAAKSALAEADDGDGTAALFWPRDEFDRLLSRWPTLAGTYGRDWDEHRGRLERILVGLSESGTTDLGVLYGSADGLAEFAGDDGDPTDEDARDDYTDELLERVEPIAWPPGRIERCWCGSTAKYKKCCLPRSRG